MQKINFFTRSSALETTSFSRVKNLFTEGPLIQRVVKIVLGVFLLYALAKDSMDLVQRLFVKKKVKVQSLTNLPLREKMYLAGGFVICAYLGFRFVTYALRPSLPAYTPLDKLNVMFAIGKYPLLVLFGYLWMKNQPSIEGSSKNISSGSSIANDKVDNSTFNPLQKGIYDIALSLKTFIEDVQKDKETASPDRLEAIGKRFSPLKKLLEDEKSSLEDENYKTYFGMIRGLKKCYGDIPPSKGEIKASNVGPTSKKWAESKYKVISSQSSTGNAESTYGSQMELALKDLEDIIHDLYVMKQAALGYTTS